MPRGARRPRGVTGWWRRVVLAGLGWLTLVGNGEARGQSIRDVAREHVREGLEQEPAPADAQRRPKKKAARPKHTPGAQPAVSAPAAGVPAAEAPVPPPPVPKSAQLPQRVFGRNFQLDPKLGGGVRGWLPEQYPLVRVDHASYYTWAVELKARLFGFLRLHRGY